MTNNPPNEVSLNDLHWELSGGKGDDVALMLEYVPQGPGPLADELAGRPVREMIMVKRTVEDIQRAVQAQVLQAQEMKLQLIRVMAYEGLHPMTHEGETGLWAVMHVILSTDVSECGQRMAIPEDEVTQHGLVSAPARSLA